jgi:hypothetical protein
VVTLAVFNWPHPAVAGPKSDPKYDLPNISPTPAPDFLPVTDKDRTAFAWRAQKESKSLQLFGNAVLSRKIDFSDFDELLNLRDALNAKPSLGKLYFAVIEEAYAIFRKKEAEGAVSPRSLARIVAYCVEKHLPPEVNGVLIIDWWERKITLRPVFPHPGLELGKLQDLTREIQEYTESLRRSHERMRDGGRLAPRMTSTLGHISYAADQLLYFWSNSGDQIEVKLQVQELAKLILMEQPWEYYPLYQLKGQDAADFRSVIAMNKFFTRSLAQMLEQRLKPSKKNPCGNSLKPKQKDDSADASPDIKWD